MKGVKGKKWRSCCKKTGWDGKQLLLGISVINPFWWPVKPSLRKWMQAEVTDKREMQFNRWYFFSDSAERRVAFDEYLRQIAQAVNQFCLEKNCYIVLLGMERLDADACKRLASMVSKPVSMVLSKDYSAFQMTGVIRNLDYLITSRYHASVLSMKRNIPVIAVSMDERLDSIMKEVGLHQKYLHHVTDKHLGEATYQSLKAAANNRKHIAKCISAYQERYQNVTVQMAVFLKQYLQNEWNRNRNEAKR